MHDVSGIVRRRNKRGPFSMRSARVPANDGGGVRRAASVVAGRRVFPERRSGGERVGVRSARVGRAEARPYKEKADPSPRTCIRDAKNALRSG